VEHRKSKNRTQLGGESARILFAASYISHSHRGFSPVSQALSLILITVSMVYRIGEEIQTVKTVSDFISPTATPG